MVEIVHDDAAERFGGGRVTQEQGVCQPPVSLSASSLPLPLGHAVVADRRCAEDGRHLTGHAHAEIRGEAPLGGVELADPVLGCVAEPDILFVRERIKNDGAAAFGANVNVRGV